jgi:hypothetical protein
MSDYKQYRDTIVRIKSTGEIGEAFESMLNTISVFVTGEDKCRYFDMGDVEFIETTPGYMTKSAKIIPITRSKELNEKKVIKWIIEHTKSF